MCIITSKDVTGHAIVFGKLRKGIDRIVRLLCMRFNVEYSGWSFDYKLELKNSGKISFLGTEERLPVEVYYVGWSNQATRMCIGYYDYSKFFPTKFLSMTDVAIIEYLDEQDKAEKAKLRKINKQQKMTETKLAKIRNKLTPAERKLLNL